MHFTNHVTLFLANPSPTCAPHQVTQLEQRAGALEQEVRTLRLEVARAQNQMAAQQAETKEARGSRDNMEQQLRIEVGGCVSDECVTVYAIRDAFQSKCASFIRELVWLVDRTINVSFK